MDVMEVCSLPRVTEVARAEGLRGGYSIDISASEGLFHRQYGLLKEADRAAVRRLVRKETPKFLIGSPPCTMFSTLVQLRRDKGSEKSQQQLDDAIVILEFLVELYQLQVTGDRYFIHEHPAHAYSWLNPKVQKLLEHELVDVSRIDMCAYNMTTNDAQGSGFAFKPTKI